MIGHSLSPLAQAARSVKEVMGPFSVGESAVSADVSTPVMSMSGGQRQTQLPWRAVRAVWGH